MLCYCKVKYIGRSEQSVFFISFVFVIITYEHLQIVSLLVNRLHFICAYPFLAIHPAVCLFLSIHFFNPQLEYV